MKQIFLLSMLLCSFFSYAQDVIVKKNGSTVVCRVVEVNSTEIVYKKWGNLNGSNYVMDRNDITAINYENGRKESLSNSSINEFAPGNQNSGQQTLNDNALLQLDLGLNNYAQKAKKLRIAGWIGGGILIAGSVILIANGYDDDVFLPCGIASGVAGIAWTSGFLIAANKQQKKANSMVQNSPLLQNEFTLSKGSSLIGSVDVIKDDIKHQHILGVGLCYNF